MSAKNPFRYTPFALELLFKERKRQYAKWGEQDQDLATWITILTEELGEAAEAVLDVKFKQSTPLQDRIAHLETELSHVGAVAVSILEYIWRHQEREEDAGQE